MVGRKAGGSEHAAVVMLMRRDGSTVGLIETCESTWRGRRGRLLDKRGRRHQRAKRKTQTKAIESPCRRCFLPCSTSGSKCCDAMQRVKQGSPVGAPAWWSDSCLHQALGLDSDDSLGRSAATEVKRRGARVDKLQRYASGGSSTARRRCEVVEKCFRYPPFILHPGRVEIEHMAEASRALSSGRRQSEDWQHAEQMSVLANSSIKVDSDPVSCLASPCSSRIHYCALLSG
jgi:hypothetical protein